MKLNYLDKFQKTIKDIKEISEEVYKELGPGFDESDYQMAMSLEFSKSKDFEAIREISVELFYKNQYLKFGELDFLIAPKKNTQGYPLPFFIETKVIDSESVGYYDQIRRYLMSLPKNNSSLINKIEIAALIVFSRGSRIEKGEAIEKEGNKIIKRKPSKIFLPDTKVYINCYYYDKNEKTIKLIPEI